jgi:site-specific recombinase XerD
LNNLDLSNPSLHTDAVVEWIKNKRNKNTKNALNTGQKKWHDSCADRGLIPNNAQPSHVCTFLIDLFDNQKKAASYISNILNAVNNLHRFDVHHALHQVSSHPLVQATMKQIVDHSPPVQHKLLPEEEELKNLFLATDFSKPTEARDHLTRTLALKGALRGAEVSAMLRKRVSVKLHNGSRYLELNFKNDGDFNTKNRKDKDPLIAEEKFSDNAWKCAVKAFEYYLVTLCQNDINPNCSEYVIFNLTKKDRGKQLSNKHLNCSLKTAKAKAGITKGFTGHSLRKFAATQAARSGVALHLIKEHGGWKSDAIFDYIETSVTERLSVSQHI